MRKEYSDPEFDLVKFRFGEILEAGFEDLVPSDPQGKEEGHGAGPDD